MPAPSSPSIPAAGRPNDRYAWFVLAALCLVYVLNFLDRQLLSILAKPIQDDLGITDGELGLLGGLYFAMFYCILGIPVAWLADRTNRVRVLSVACALWSAATIACGMSTTYVQLAVARMGVGIGEAGGVPPSYSIISDYFPPERRGLALGLFNLGPPLGQALGVAFGARIAAAYDWRLAFLLLGAAGLIAAAGVWAFVREPRRGATDAVGAAEPAGDAPGFGATMKMFFSRSDLTLVALAAGATQFITYATLGFTTLFLMREKAMTLDQIAIWYALLLGVGVSGGIYLSGRLVDRHAARRPEAYGLIPAIGLALAVPFFIGFVHTPTWPLAMLFLFVPTFLNYLYLTPAVTLVQNAVPARQRTLAGAVLLLIMNLIGLGLGPTWLGAVSDWAKPAHPGNSLQIAFYSLVPFYFIAIALHLALARVLKHDHRKNAA
ncbi:putative MFS family arabinose efflux permease [Sphingopyxis panaciterrae]|uniref:spinster family MFS transporter n=1 Tax=Sphingopyxis panaciterrae TaxID=363841 RepID=UPI00141E2214|nr:MFS transporter [Sphingopyxis panaciterrae]NIJ38258.1 putative MFS family arabinose efflux permease [Sphingopyxis panaciterrae]